MRMLKSSLAIICAFSISTQVFAFDDEPEVRVARKVVKTVGKYNEKGPHPLDAAIEIALRGLKRMESIKDYEAQLIKRERINGKLSGLLYCDLKIRNENVKDEVPFSIYMNFTKPSTVNGREAIWVNGQNGGKIIAHEAGSILGKLTVYLNPEGPIAMKGNRYPMHQAGFKVLVEKLIEKATREKQYGECEVKIESGRKFAKRPCTVIEVVHPEPRDYFEFHKALIYIDDEMQLPVRYEAYTWPKQRGGEAVLLEQYCYTKIKLNVGLSDMDFNPRNKKYNYTLPEAPLTKKKDVVKVAENTEE